MKTRLSLNGDSLCKFKKVSNRKVRDLFVVLVKWNGRRVIDVKIEERTKILMDYGFTNVRHVSIMKCEHRLKHVYSISHNGRTEELEYSKILTLMKNGIFFWPEDRTYEQCIKELKRVKAMNRVVSDEERRRKSKSRIGYKVADSVKRHQSEKRTGYKRWYHPDFPSFKQARECPGEGWAQRPPHE